MLSRTGDIQKVFLCTSKMIGPKNCKINTKNRKRKRNGFPKSHPLGCLFRIDIIPSTTGPTLAAFQQSSPPHFPEGHHVACLDNMRFSPLTWICIMLRRRSNTRPGKTKTRTFFALGKSSFWNGGNCFFSHHKTMHILHLHIASIAGIHA